MNIKNIQKLIDLLKSDDNPVGFEMSNWFMHQNKSVLVSDIKDVIKDHSCGTVACIAGHAMVLLLEEDFPLRSSVSHTAADWLELDPDESHNLFYGHWTAHERFEITKKEAIKELKYLINLEVLGLGTRRPIFRQIAARNLAKNS